MVEIDGSYGEGGGQILRSSLTLSALTGMPLHIHHIRTNRDQPGLRQQHLTAVKAIGRITRAEVQGATLNSTELTLKPKGIHAGKYQFDIPTAGALTLVLQTIFLPLSFADGTSWVALTGGTHVHWSPIYHYLQEHWLPIMDELGLRLKIALGKAGFFPGGGGEVTLKVLQAKSLKPFTCTDRGDLVTIRGLSGVANLEDDIAKRQKHQALKRLYDVCQNSKIKTMRLPAPGKGTFVLLKADFANCGSACFTALGAPGKPAEQVADEAVDQLMDFFDTDGCLDHFLADQLLLPLSFVRRMSKFRTDAITGHLRTNAHVIQQFLPVAIEIEGEENTPGLVRVKGISPDSLPII
ncbi:MAG: RNA 3'-terminal phosphate cyclase [Brevefilum sp.]